MFVLHLLFYFSKQMTTSKKLIVIVLYIMTSQILRIYIESSLLQTPVLEHADPLLQRLVPSSSDHDFGGKYLINTFYKSEGFSPEDISVGGVTLVTHCSIDRLHTLIEISEKWRGPISVSVFTPGFDASFFDDAIDGLRLCWRQIREQITFHLVAPLSHKPNVSETGKFVYLSCRDITRRLKSRKASFSHMDNATYPRNVMRNVARYGALTPHILEVDVDVVPSPKLWLKLSEFLREIYNNSRSEIRNSKELYVIPIFEFRQGVSVRNKQELTLAVEEKDARPFLQEICSECHWQTNYESWLSHATNDSDSMNVLYGINFVRGWEPFFVSSRFVPNYDANFLKFGQDRLSYLCLLQANGYKFNILSDEFLSYNGYRIKSKLKSFERVRKYKREAFNNEFAVALKQNGYFKRIYQKC